MKHSLAIISNKRATVFGRSLACLLLLILAGCGSAPEKKAEPQPTPEKLVDHTDESAYRLGAVTEKLDQAAAYERRGQRAAAEAIIGAAQLMLEEDFARERQYLEVLKAGVWAREGDGRDAAKATSILEPIEAWAIDAGDGRLYSDAMQVLVLLELAERRPTNAASAGSRALEALENLEAYVRFIEVARELALVFADARHLPSAGTFARRALNMARRLDDDLQLLQASLDIGYVYMLSSVEFEGSYKRAYEAAYRLDSLGWRNVVIAQAAGAHYIAGDMSGCVRWGDRMRDRAMGAMPGVQDSQLWIDDYITLMCQYTLALNETQPESPRIEETRQLALAAIETLEGDARAGWSDVEENLRGEPLNPGEEK